MDVKVRAKSIKTPDVFFANPSAEEALKDEKLETLDTNGSTNNNTGKLIASLYFISPASNIFESCLY